METPSAGAESWYLVISTINKTIFLYKCKSIIHIYAINYELNYPLITLLRPPSIQEDYVEPACNQGRRGQKCTYHAQ